MNGWLWDHEQESNVSSKDPKGCYQERKIERVKQFRILIAIIEKVVFSLNLAKKSYHIGDKLH